MFWLLLRYLNLGTSRGINLELYCTEKYTASMIVLKCDEKDAIGIINTYINIYHFPEERFKIKYLKVLREKCEFISNFRWKIFVLHEKCWRKAPVTFLVFCIFDPRIVTIKTHPVQCEFIRWIRKKEDVRWQSCLHLVLHSDLHYNTVHSSKSTLCILEILIREFSFFMLVCL